METVQETIAKLYVKIIARIDRNIFDWAPMRICLYAKIVKQQVKEQAEYTKYWANGNTSSLGKHFSAIYGQLYGK